MCIFCIKTYCILVHLSQISVHLETLRIAESRRGIRKAWLPVKLLLLATYLLRLERVTSGYVFGESCYAEAIGIGERLQIIVISIRSGQRY